MQTNIIPAIIEKHSNTLEFIILLEPTRFATTHTTIKNAKIYVIGTSGKYKILKISEKSLKRVKVKNNELKNKEIYG